MVFSNDPRTVSGLMARIPPSAVILDLFMPYVNGETILAEINRDYPAVPVIVITGSMNVDTAVACMKSGAYDYMVKPVEKSRLVSGLRNAIEHSSMQEQLNELGQRLMRNSDLVNRQYFSAIVTASDSMEAVFRYAESVAPSPMPVLILGESGTGKELIAQAIHKASGRKGKMVAVNAGGMDDDFFSDNLFGHRKGAFTGASTARAGLIEQATGGTLFLDEIGDLDIRSQTKLLRLLQQKEYYHVGSDIPNSSDARIIAATNSDLIEKLDKGNFRKDLYYRIRTHLIELPSLSERREDIPLLTKHFLDDAASLLNKTITSVPDELYSLLSAYRFPGNVRELQALVFDAVSRHESGPLRIAPFREYLQRENIQETTLSIVGASDDFSIHFQGKFPRLKEVEDLCIQRAFEKANGNQSVAAILLGISQSTLSRRIKSKKQYRVDVAIA
jgi:DNA-binding NtrC family response regulator